MDLGTEIKGEAIHSGRMSADERRQQLLQVAIKLFSQNGFSGTTTKEIARSAGISEAMVFRHFTTKTELYDALISHLTAASQMDSCPWEKEEETWAAFEKGDDYTFFYNFGLNALRHHKRDTEFMRLLFHSALEGHQLSEMFFEQFVSKIYEFLSSYIKRRQEEGAMRDVTPRVVVRAFLGMLIQHSLNNILWDKERKLLNISDEEAAHEFANVLLHGVLKPTGETK